jgi:hypothetical protein
VSSKTKKRILLVNPLPSLSLYSWPEVRDITGHPAYIMNIAPPTLAAMTPPEVEVSIVDEAVEPVSFDGDWDLVGVTGYLTQMRRMCEIADEFRRRGRLVAIGGPYASLSHPTSCAPTPTFCSSAKQRRPGPLSLRTFWGPLASRVPLDRVG